MFVNFLFKNFRKSNTDKITGPFAQKNIISKEQHGFGIGFTTENAVYELIN